MFERIARGFRLLGASWRLLMADKELLLLPFLSFVAIVAVVGALGGGAFAVGLFEEEGGNEALSTLVLFVIYFACTFLGVFFNAALVAAAMERLQGGDPTVASALRTAVGKLDKIVLWSLVAATVGLVLRMLEERAGWLGRLVIRLLGAAWGVLTFFVVPVLLFEPQGVRGALQRSGAIVRQRWGEQLAGNASLHLALVLIALPLILVLVLLGGVDERLAILLGIPSLGLLLAVGGALSGIFNAVLYRFATTGEVPESFPRESLEHAFARRR